MSRRFPLLAPFLDVPVLSTSRHSLNRMLPYLTESRITMAKLSLSSLQASIKQRSARLLSQFVPGQKLELAESVDKLVPSVAITEMIEDITPAMADKSTSTTELSPSSPVNPQLDSGFLQKLPLELRKMIYIYSWNRWRLGYHIYWKNGRPGHYKCCRDPELHDPDCCQRSLDYYQGQMTFNWSDEGHMRMWYDRLVSPWGYRHFECEDRYRVGSREDDGRFVPDLMLVCKRM
jgi:hypothetical protein